MSEQEQRVELEAAADREVDDAVGGGPAAEEAAGHDDSGTDTDDEGRLIQQVSSRAVLALQLGCSVRASEHTRRTRFDWQTGTGPRAAGSHWPRVACADVAPCSNATQANATLKQQTQLREFVPQPVSGKGKPPPKRPAGAITLRTLVEAGFLDPGPKVLHVEYKGSITYGDLTDEGLIYCAGEEGRGSTKHAQPPTPPPTNHCHWLRRPSSSSARCRASMCRMQANSTNRHRHFRSGSSARSTLGAKPTTGGRPSSTMAGARAISSHSSMRRRRSLLLHAPPAPYARCPCASSAQCVPTPPHPRGHDCAVHRRLLEWYKEKYLRESLQEYYGKDALATHLGGQCWQPSTQQHAPACRRWRPARGSTHAPVHRAAGKTCHLAAPCAHCAPQPAPSGRMPAPGHA